MFCENCGKENLDGGRVCAHCGKELQTVKKEVDTPAKGQTLLKVLLIVSFCLTAVYMMIYSMLFGGFVVGGPTFILYMFLTWPLAIVVFALGVGRKGNKTLEILSIIDFLLTIVGPTLLNFSSL